MLLVQTLLTSAYLAFVARVWLLSRRRAGSDLPCAEGQGLPADDQAPESAVGWPPLGQEFSPYVEDGLAALDAYLSGGLAP